MSGVRTNGLRCRLDLHEGRSGRLSGIHTGAPKARFFTCAALRFRMTAYRLHSGHVLDFVGHLRRRREDVDQSWFWTEEWQTRYDDGPVR